MIAVALMQKKLPGTLVWRSAIVKAVPKKDSILWIRQEWIEPPPERRTRTIIHNQAASVAKSRSLLFLGFLTNRSPANVSLLELLAEVSNV
jgi:hypothetical protein